MPYSFSNQSMQESGQKVDFTARFLDGDELKVQPINRDYKKDYRVDDGVPIMGVFDPGLATALNDSVPLDTTYLPTKKEVTPNSGSNKDFFKYLPCFAAGGGVHYMVCETFKQLVEELEPGVHRFFPIDLYGPDGKLYSRRYYFQILNRVAFLDKERSDFDVSRGVMEMGNIGYGPIYYDHQAVEGLHLWRDRYYGRNGVFVSDELAQRIMEANLKGVQLNLVKDRPYPVPEKYLGASVPKDDG